MPLVSRKSGGGRKPVSIPNPFVIKDDWGDDFNVLWCTEDELDQRIEDILIGCIRSFSSEVNVEGAKTGRKEVVDWQKLLRVYRNVWQLNQKDIQNYLQCSKTTSNTYCKVIKLCNPFIQRYMDGKSGSNIISYIDVHKRQVKSGYLRIL